MLSVDPITSGSYRFLVRLIAYCHIELPVRSPVPHHMPVNVNCQSISWPLRQMHGWLSAVNDLVQSTMWKSHIAYKVFLTAQLLDTSKSTHVNHTSRKNKKTFVQLLSRWPPFSWDLFLGRQQPGQMYRTMWRDVFAFHLGDWKSFNHDVDNTLKTSK